MNFLTVVVAFVLGGVTVIALGIQGFQSFFGGIRDSLGMLFG